MQKFVSRLFILFLMTGFGTAVLLDIFTPAYGQHVLKSPNSLDELPITIDLKDQGYADKIRFSAGPLTADLGTSIATGDLNGDGFADVIFGSPTTNHVISTTGANVITGAVYILFGGADIRLETEITVNNSPRTIEIFGGFHQDGNGDPIPDQFGHSVATGDLNGDGFDDLLIGAFTADGQSSVFQEAGKVYVFFGSDTVQSQTIIEVTTPPAYMKTIIGAQLSDWAGWAVAAGDVNGDGFDDMVIGAMASTPILGIKNLSGSIYIIYGNAQFASAGNVILPAGTTSAPGITNILGDFSFGAAGHSVAIGNFNNDEFDDVLIGAPGLWQTIQDPPEGFGISGKAFILFGSANIAEETLMDLFQPTVFVLDLWGVNENDLFGSSVFAGDFNGDGFDEAIIGAPRADPAGKQSAGESYILFASSIITTFDDIRFAENQDRTIRIIGKTAQDLSGTFVSSGDINGDGIQDILIGAPAVHFEDRADAGATYLIFGTPDKLERGDIDLGSDPPPSFLVSLFGDNQLSGFGSSGAVGDVDNDGFGDMIASSLGPAEGTAPLLFSYLVWGKGEPITSITEGQIPFQPGNFQLLRNYPNPFNPSTSIEFQVPKTVPVSLRIYNVLGGILKTLLNATLAPGSYALTWDGTDDHGNVVPSGIYFYALQAGEYRETRKLMLLK